MKKGGSLRYEIWGKRKLYLSEWEQAAKEYVHRHYGDLVGYDEPQLDHAIDGWRVPLHVTYFYPLSKTEEEDKRGFVVFYGVGELIVKIKDLDFVVTSATPRDVVNKRMDELLAKVAKSAEELKRL